MMKKEKSLMVKVNFQVEKDKIIIIISHDWEIAELCDKVVKI